MTASAREVEVVAKAIAEELFKQYGYCVHGPHVALHESLTITTTEIARAAISALERERGK